MSKMRVYEVARDLAMDNKALVALFQSVGVTDVRNHMSAVLPEQIDRVKRHLERQSGQKASEERIRPTVVKRRARPDGSESSPPPAEEAVPPVVLRQHKGPAPEPVSAPMPRRPHLRPSRSAVPRPSRRRQRSPRRRPRPSRPLRPRWSAHRNRSSLRPRAAAPVVEHAAVESAPAPAPESQARPAVGRAPEREPSTNGRRTCPPLRRPSRLPRRRSSGLGRRPRPRSSG